MKGSAHSFVDYLTLDRILVFVRPSSKEALLRDLARIFAACLGLKDVAGLERSIFEREAAGNTGIGRGLGFPIGRSAEIDRVKVLLAVLSSPLDYGSLDGEPVRIVLLVVKPATDSSQNEYLEVTALTARILGNRQVRDAILVATSPHEVLEIIVSAERGSPLPTEQRCASSGDRLRRTLTGMVRNLKWFLLLLYVGIIFGLAITSLCYANQEDRWIVPMEIGVLIGLQLLFLFGAGITRLSQPISRYRLLLPVIAASAVTAFLTTAFCIALGELLSIKGWADRQLWAVLFCVNVLVSGVTFFVYCRNVERYRVLTWLTLGLLAGSLTVLLVCIPSHIITLRRHMHLSGMGTMMGIFAGCYTALWALGTGVALLFLKDKARWHTKPRMMKMA